MSLTPGTGDGAAVAITTLPRVEDAQRLGRSLVAARLAACVHVLPLVQSIYRWKDSVCDEAETILVIKTRMSRIEDVKREIVARHPYELPEFLVLEVDGSDEYLSWIADVVRPTPMEDQ